MDDGNYFAKGVAWGFIAEWFAVLEFSGWHQGFGHPLSLNFTLGIITFVKHPRVNFKINPFL